MKAIRTSNLILVLVLVSFVGVVTLQQSVFAPRTCTGCGDFLKLTAQFEKAVIGAVNPPEPDKVGQFRQLTGQWKSDVINAVLQSPPEPDKILRLHGVYEGKVLTIGWGGDADIIEGLLDAYSQGVIEIFELGPR